MTDATDRTHHGGSTADAIVPPRAAAAAAQATQALLDTHRAWLKHGETCRVCPDLRRRCETGLTLWRAHTAAQAAMRPAR